jgi:hypothetical protein
MNKQSDARRCHPRRSPGAVDRVPAKLRRSAGDSFDHTVDQENVDTVACQEEHAGDE